VAYLAKTFSFTEDLSSLKEGHKSTPWELDGVQMHGFDKYFSMKIHNDTQNSASYQTAAK